MEAKFKAMDIANFYIKLAKEIEDDSFDNLKINKMLYFAQAWALVKLGHPIFSDSIQAWDYGPVIPDVYRAFKCCGSMPIDSPIDDFDETELSTEELELLLDVYRNYGQFTGLALKNMTHIMGSPWNQVYEKGMNKVIPNDLIQAYFKDKSLDSFDIDSLNIPVITEVPASWDSPEDSIYD